MRVIRAYRSDNKIAVDFGGSERVKADLQALIVPSRMHTSSNTLRFPLIWESCKGIRKVADANNRRLIIGESLKEWAVIERRRKSKIPDVQSTSKQRLPVLRRTYPFTHKAINSRKFQTVGAKFIATNRSALIADEPGLGKTLQTIAAIVESRTKGPILVTGPSAAVGITWPEQIEQWAPGEKIVNIAAHLPPIMRKQAVVNACRQAGSETQGRVWICVGPNYLRRRIRSKGNKYVKDAQNRNVYDYVREAIPEFFDFEFAAVIVDESHLTLAGCTGNLLKQSAQRQGIGGLRVRKNGLRVAMSGTPFRGKQDYLWGQLNWLRPDIYKSYWKWVEKHFDVFTDGFSEHNIGELIDEAALYEEASAVMLRRTKAEVAKDLPPKNYCGKRLDGDGVKAVWLPMHGKQKKQYEQMVKHGVADLIGGGRIMANGTLPELTRLRQIACGAGQSKGEDFVYAPGYSNKYDWLVNFLEERGIAGTPPTGDGKVIVTSQFTGLLNMYFDELKKIGVASYLYTGQTKKSDQKKIKQAFQAAGGPRVILLNMQSGGTSLTLDSADDVVLLDMPWNRDDAVQVEDRAHRLSRMHQVNIWPLLSLGTVEEGIARTATDNEFDIKNVIDGQRGVAFDAILRGRRAA